MREAWVLRQDRKRSALAWCLTLLAYGLCALAMLLLGMCSMGTISERSGPLLIKIGSAEGLDDPARSTGLTQQGDPGSQAEPAAAEPAAADPESPPEDPEPAEGKVIHEASPAPAASAAAKRPEADASPRPSAPARSPRPDAATPRPTGAAARPDEPSGGEKPEAFVIAKGKESGNNYETSFEADPGSSVGRGLYVPIYLYLPLPYEVEAGLVDKIPPSPDGLLSHEARRAHFAKFYKPVEGAWRQKAPIPPEQRPNLWLALADSGYDLSQASYKKDKVLRAVIIGFKVGSTRDGQAPKLEEAKLLKSSGYSDLDDAVIYGFKQASFYNDSPLPKSGRFSYSFE